MEAKTESVVTQLCPTLCDPVDCSLPGSSAHGIFQAIVLEWIVISFSRGSAVILETQKIKSDTVSSVSPSISHQVMGPDAMIFVF